MLKIHGVARSRAFRCIWAAEEAGQPYEVIPVAFGPTMKAAIAAVNPNGKIPALQDGALMLFESLAINLHIAGKSGAPFMPAGDDGSRALQWTLWAATEAEPAAMQWAYNTYILPPEQRSAAEAARGITTLAAKLAVLEGAIAGPWLLGKHFTIADCNLAGVLYGAWAAKLDMAATPRVQAWLDACFERPAALKARAQREG